MSRTPRRVSALLLAGAMVVITACGGDDSSTSTDDTDDGSAAVELTTIKLVTSSSGPSAGQTPIYMAIEQGWFEEEGIKVEILPAPGSGAAIQQLAAGNADFASTTPASVMQATLLGEEMAMVYQHTYIQPFDISAPAGSGIESVEDLKGKTLGVSELSGGEMPMVRAAIAVAGLTEGTDVKIIPAGEGDVATAEAFNSGAIDAYAGSRRDIISIGVNGFESEMVSITPEEIAAWPGDGLALRAEFLEEEPELVDAFVRAALKGWIYATANPDKAFAFMQENVPDALASDPVLSRTFFDLSFKGFELSSTTTVTQIGLSDKAGWTSIMEYLQVGTEETKVLDGPVDLDAILQTGPVERAYEAIDVDAILALAEEA